LGLVLKLAGTAKKHLFKKDALLAYCGKTIFKRKERNMKKYSKPAIKKHAELKSVTFSAH
jgi:hypothetical protein